MVLWKYKINITKLPTRIILGIIAVIVGISLVTIFEIGLEWFLHTFFSILEVLV